MTRLSHATGAIASCVQVVWPQADVKLSLIQVCSGGAGGEGRGEGPKVLLPGAVIVPVPIVMMVHVIMRAYLVLSTSLYSYLAFLT